jgi:hypothetical protein
MAMVMGGGGCDDRSICRQRPGQAGCGVSRCRTNGPSRRLAESLGGTIIGTQLLRKADGVEHPEVVYRIPAPILN